MECRARWAFGKGKKWQATNITIRNQSRNGSRFHRTKRTHSTAGTSKYKGICRRQTKRKDRHDRKKNQFDLKECKNIIAVFETKDGAKNIAFGEFNWLVMAKAIYSLNKTIIEETLKLQEDASASLKYIEALLDVNKKKEQV